jgi:mannitol/fructose-specific phosphotransferase system IIA component (Ntr-type)
MAVVRSRRFSRYPLCRDGLDSAFGLFHVKDLALSVGPREARGLEAYKRELASLSASDPLQKALGTFASKGTHLALVKGPGGEPAGIVTLEDVLEELIGEVHDEFDRPQAWSLMDVLVPNAVEVGLEDAGLESLFKRLVKRLAAAQPSLNAAEAVRLLAEREVKFSSAVGHAVAIPHARLPDLDRALVAVGRAAKAFPFAPPDKVPVRLAFLILTPAGTPILQLRILARVASLVSNENLRRRLLRAKSAEHLAAVLKTADALVAD